QRQPSCDSESQIAFLALAILCPAGARLRNDPAASRKAQSTGKPIMKSMLAGLIMFGLLIGQAMAEVPSPFVMRSEPKPMPELSFTDASGKIRSLSEFKGKVVLLNIWATWCGPCRKEMPTFDRLQAALGGPDFEIVPLSVDRKGMEVVEKFYAENGIKSLARYVTGSSNEAFEKL